MVLQFTYPDQLPLGKLLVMDKILYQYYSAYTSSFNV